MLDIDILFFDILDQNRNKTAKPGTKQPATKKSNQPDVVSNSLTKANAAAEISRLEALCETRTKELNYTRMQLRAGLSAFDGMAVLVRYLTEQVSLVFFSTSNWKVITVG